MAYQTHSTHKLLREATKILHQKANSLPDMRLLISPNLTLTEYRRILTRMWGFIFPVETHILLSGYLISWFEYRMNDLRNDLHLLGISMTDLNVRQHYECSHFGSGLESILGIAYVLEGSRQGGSVIRQKISKSLGEKNLENHRFFKTVGSDSGDRWDLLFKNTDHMSCTDLNQILLSSQDCFRGYIEWMS